MRTFSKGRLARTISLLLTAAFLFTIGFPGIGILPASAQVVTRGATAQSVAVVPFANQTRIRPEMLGEDAAAAVAVELRDRLLLDVLPKADVTLQMRDLGLAAPLTNGELVRIATELDLALLVTGEVRDARIVRSEGGRYAEVVLAVRLFDRVARADVNGALVVGRGPSSVDATDVELIEKALQDAAFSAVEQMKTRPTVTAMVLWARGETVFLNVGTRGGLRDGMEMVAVRSGERIGKVVVTNADAIGSYANIVEGPPLRTGDHLRAIWKVPAGPGLERVGVAKAKRKRFETYALAAGLLLGFGSFASRANSVDEGDIVVPNFKAVNLANGSELGYSGWLFDDVTMMFSQTPATLLTWDPYDGTQKDSVVAYEIWRNGEIIGIIELVSGAPDYTIDALSSPTFLTTTISIEDDETGEVSFETDADVWDTDDLEAWMSDNVPIVPGATVFEDGEWAYYASGTSFGPWEGVLYSYQIRPVVLTQFRDADGDFSWRLMRGQLTSPNNIVQSIAGPVAYPWHYVFQGYIDNVYEDWSFEWNPEIVANTATFYFYSPIGADEAILQVTREPNSLFDPNGIFEQEVPVAAYMEQAVNVDLSQVPGTGDVFWWRVGARNRRDTNPPEPWPSSFTNDFGWVWSNRNSFTVTTLSRAALMRERPEALDRLRSAGARVPRTASTDRVLRTQ